MKTKLLKLLVVMTISITALFALGITASAATAGDFTITLTEGGGDPVADTDYTYADGVLTIKSSAAMTISGTTTTDRIEVADGVSANITLAGVNIDVSSQSNKAAFKIADNSTGNVTITLANGTTNTLKSGGDCAGLQKNGEYSETLGKLTITGTGSLTATGGAVIGGGGGAGIGGGFEDNGSNITISGGVVIAQGGGYAYGGAGIGGGGGGSSSNIEISGGTVTATGGEDGAGIGGGYGGSSSNIEISGGTVTATGVSDGAGIGGGWLCSGSDIKISGGVVTATGGAGGAGIGGGGGGSSSNIKISGGSVKADTIGCTPTDGTANATPVYLLELDVDGTSAVTINGKAYPTNHINENKLYVYLPAGNYTVANGNSQKLYTIADDGTVSEVVVGTAFTITGTDLVYGTDYTYPADTGVLTILSLKAVTIANADPSTSTTNRIEVAGGVSANITLAGVNIDVPGTEYAAAFKIADNSAGNVTITLADGTTNTLKSGRYCAGLQKNGAYISETQGKLTITGTGLLTATGGNYGAGIGGGDGCDGSNITISGGTVTATGGIDSAGIGGGAVSSGSYITISGGVVTATGGISGAGIGGGAESSGSYITISGGTVTATSGGYGAGIGGGIEGSGSNITISGGEVIANGGGGAYGGAGIGGGGGGSGSNIKISGGTVTATGGDYGAGIGGGAYGSGSYIEISGGVVNATGGTGGAGIGGGISADNITISGGSVKAVAGTVYQNCVPAAIGQGVQYDSNKDVHSNGAEVTPTDGNGNNVYLLELDVDGTSAVTANGKAYPTKHFDENKVYIYLPAKTAQAPNEVTVGNETTKYCYDIANSKWLTVVDTPEADDTEFTYNGEAQTYTLAESDYYTITGNVQTNIGTYTVTVALKDGYIWNDGTTDDKEYTFTIEKPASAVVTAPTPIERAYNESAQELINAGTATGGEMQYSLEENGEYSTTIPTGTNAGTYIVWYKVVGDENHSDTEPESVEAEIAKVTPQFVYTKKTPTYTGEAQELVAIDLLSDGCTVKFSFDRVNWSSDIPTGTNAGDYKIYYIITGSVNYSDYSGNNFNVSIAKAIPEEPAVPTATAISYGEKLSASTLSDSSWAWVDGTIVPNASAYYNAYIEVDDSNYDYTGVYGYDDVNHRVVRDITVIINKATLTITANSYTIKVGDTLPTYAYDVTGLVNNDTLPFDVSLSCSATDSNTVGTYPITISGVASDALASCYAPIYVNGTLTISEKDNQEIAADDVTLTYGETKNIGATTNGNGAIYYSTTSDVISVAADGTITALKAGTATVTITAAENADYAEATKTISVTVNKKKVAVPTADTTEYTYTGTAQTYGVTSTDDYTVEGGVQTNAGEYPVTITLNNENYEWDGTLGTYKFVINKAAVTVTAKSYTIKVGEALPTYAYDVAGLVNGETLPIDVTISCNAADSNTAGTYTITVSGAANSTNYTFAYVNGTLTISNTSEQTITASDVTLTYGETGKKIIATTSGDGAISYSTTSDVISVAADGTITALKAGTATVTITAAETDTYAAAACEITVTVEKAPIVADRVQITLDVIERPYPNMSLPGTVDVASDLRYSISISWDPADEKAGYNTVYTAKAYLTAEPNYTFAEDISLEDWEVVSNSGAVLVAKRTYNATRKAELFGITLPKAVTLTKYYDKAQDAIAELPTTVMVEVEGSENAIAMPITWKCEAYVTSPNAVNIFVWTIKPEAYATYDAGNVDVSGRVAITNSAELPAATPTPTVTDPGKPFIQDETGKIGWVVIEDELEKATAGETVCVNMNGATVVPGYIFDEIKGQDITITLLMDNGISWTVYGKDVTAKSAKDIDLAVTVATESKPVNNIPVNVLNKVTGEKYHVNISLKHNGELGMKAILNINLDAKNKGLFANLFYYNVARNSMQFVWADDIDENGMAHLVFDHASEYSIVIDKEIMQKSATAVQTGDDSVSPVLLVVIMLVSLLAAGGIFLYLYKGKQNGRRGRRQE